MMQFNKNKLVVFNKRWLDSPTLMTWGSFLSRSLSLVIILPLTLNRLDASEIAVWFLFSTIITLQTLIDLGFTPTFTRVFAYGMSGISSKELSTRDSNRENTPNWDCIRLTIQTVNFIYHRLGIVWFIGLLIFGTPSVYRQIQYLPDVKDGWISWSIILISSYFIVQGNKYVSILQGVNKISLLRRWEIVTSIAASATMILAIIIWNNLIAIVASHQLWQIINIIRNKMLIDKGDLLEIRIQHERKRDADIFNAVWPSAWRSGLGILMSFGLIQLTGVYFAQIHSSVETAQYLFTLRLIHIIVQFSQAPFYSKIPMFSMMYASRKQNELIKALERSMLLSYVSYVVPFAILYFFGNIILQYIGSQIIFPDQMLWMLFGLAYFVERYGAMHIQIYSLTNKIIWHIANGISGVIFIILTLYLENRSINYSIPIGLFFANLMFYSWFSSIHSYKILKTGFFEFERKTSLGPLFLLLIIFILSILSR